MIKVLRYALLTSILIIDHNVNIFTSAFSSPLLHYHHSKIIGIQLQTTTTLITSLHSTTLGKDTIQKTSNEDDDFLKKEKEEEEDRILRSLYPSKNNVKPLFQQTNVIVQSFPPPRMMTIESSNTNKKSLSWFINEILPSDDKNDNDTQTQKRQQQTTPNLFLNKIGKWMMKQTKNGSNYDTSGVDVLVEFQNARDGAREIVHRCLLKIQYQQLTTKTTYDETTGCECCDDTDTKQKDRNRNDLKREYESNENKNEYELQEIIDYFTNIFTYFQDIFNDNTLTHTSTNNNDIKTTPNTTLGYKARIVSSLGQNGMKCPRWHIDHVPIRLVMSLKGPGCVYVPHEIEMNYKKEAATKQNKEECVIINRTALNGIDIDDSKIANEIIIPKKNEIMMATIGKEMEAILLMGRCWEDMGKEEEKEDHGDYNKNVGRILAVPHRSPDLGVNEMRILLTIDVLPVSTIRK